MQVCTDLSSRKAVSHCCVSGGRIRLTVDAVLECAVQALAPRPHETAQPSSCRCGSLYSFGIAQTFRIRQTYTHLLTAPDLGIVQALPPARTDQRAERTQEKRRSLTGL
jgi:hypothetical protein